VENEVFYGGPPLRLERWLRVRKAGDTRVLGLAIGAAAVTWLPLLVLTIVRGDFLHHAGGGSFLQDFAVHARYLIAVPLMVLAEATCISQLGAIAQHFVVANVVREADRPRFDAVLASIRRLRDSYFAEILAVACAYLLVLAIVYSVSQRPPGWQLAAEAGTERFSPAGWWQLLVSLPILLVFLLGWVWKLFLWARFLWLVSRLDLHLVASHPDRAGGLMFAGHSLQAWALPAATPSVIIAGSVANLVIHGGASILDFKYLILGITVCMLVLCTAPLVVFSKNLISTWRSGVWHYGSLAERVGHKFEKEWLERGRGFAENPLQTPAFSATTDLYQVVSNVYAMKVVPIDPLGVAFLGAITLLPFLPVLLGSQPLDELLKKLVGFLI
jgi:hypothetical protein